MSMIDDFLDMYMKLSPMQTYPFEVCVISITFFCFALWLMGTRINQEIIEQISIPLIHEIKQMGFTQNPGFNTLTHSVRRDYRLLPSLSASKANQESTTTPTTKTTDNDDDDVDHNTVISNINPHHYLWSENHTSHHLYATGHPNLNGIHCYINNIPRHDLLLQIGSLFKILPNSDTITIQIAFSSLDPFFWSLSRDDSLIKQLFPNAIRPTKQKQEQEKPIKSKNTTTTTTTSSTSQQQESIGNVIDLGGLKFTHSLLPSFHLITTDTPELIHDTKLQPVPTDVIEFFITIDENTDNAFVFQSLTISDQNDGYEIVKYNEIPGELLKTNTYNPTLKDDEAELHEESALLTLIFNFNFNNVPPSTNDNDPNNQVYVNTWISKICVQLFYLSQKFNIYQLPDKIYNRNLKIRDDFDPTSVVTPEKKQDTPKEIIEARDGIKNSIIGGGNTNNNQLRKRNIAPQ